jgi:putative aldouronate transport system substrate-binding protein
MARKTMSRRHMLKWMGMGAAGAALAACQPKTVIVETEKEVTRVVIETVKETVIVEGTPEVVEREVTKVVKETVVVEPTPVPAPEGPITIEYLVGGLGVAMPKPEEDPIKLGIDAAVGIDFRIFTVPAGQYQSALAVRLAGGDAPDIFNASRITLPEYADQGVLYDLTPHVGSMAGAAEFVGGDEALALGQIDGKQYGFPGRSGMSARYFEYWIRQDWLDAVNLDLPTTLDEWVAVMEAFTTQDPDGNGNNDTFGLSGGPSHAPNAVIGAFTPILGAFGVGRPGDFYVKDGAVISAYLDPAMKDALAYIKGVIDKGVVDPELVSNTGMMHRDKAFQGLVGTIWIDWASMTKDQFVEERLAIDPNSDWVPLHAPQGPGGASSHFWDSTAVGFKAFPADLEPYKVPKIAELLNFVTSKEGVYLTSFGVEGDHYELDAEGHVVRLPLLDEQGGYFYLYQMLGRDDKPYLYSKFVKQIPYIDFSFAEPHTKLVNSLVEIPEGYNPSDANDYGEVEIIKFIYGDRPLAEYDDFVNTLLTTYGYQQMVDAAQAVNVS